MQKFIRYLGILCVSAVFVACGSGDSGKANEVGKKKDDKINLKDVTNRKGCQGAPRVADTPFQEWRLDYEGRSDLTGAIFEITMLSEFRGSEVLVTANCSYRGESAQVRLRSRVRVDETAKTIEFLEAAQATQKFGDMSCSVSTGRGRLKYLVTGTCLQLDDGKTKNHLVATAPN